MIEFVGWSLLWLAAVAVLIAVRRWRRRYLPGPFDRLPPRRRGDGR